MDLLPGVYCANDLPLTRPARTQSLSISEFARAPDFIAEKSDHHAGDYHRVFVVVPTVITLIVPFTDLTFHRNAGGASVTVKRYALMVIPWQTTDIANVKTIRADFNQSFRYADTAENRRKGRAGAINHATGQLVILGDDR